MWLFFSGQNCHLLKFYAGFIKFLYFCFKCLKVSDHLLYFIVQAIIRIFIHWGHHNENTCLWHYSDVHEILQVK